MTRLVPRPDWTPEDVAAAIWAVASSLSDQRYLQLNTPDRIEAFARLPAVLALFRPAEEPGIITATADHARPLEPIPWDDDYPRETPAPVAPPPAEERADLPASEESSWAPVLVESRTPETESVMIHHAHRGQACVACELAALRSELSASQREVERLRQQLDPPTQSGSFGATTAKVAGKCIQCNGDIYHDPHHIGEYLHVCVPPGENRSGG